MWPWLFNPAILIKPILKPLARLVVGLLAIPLFRLITKYVFRIEEMDKELQQDLEQWFKASLVLLVVTHNMEKYIFGWVPNFLSDEYYILMGLRIMMVIGVIESMPDQALFAIIHPGPPKPYYNKSIGFWKCFRMQCWPMLKGFVCQHINRSSPVFAILSAIVQGTAGWVFFGMAILQYLIIGLVTSRDRALDVLKAFDEQVALKRHELEVEFGVNQNKENHESAPMPSTESAPESNYKDLSKAATS